MVHFKYLNILKNRNNKKLCRLFIQEINVYFSYYSLTAEVPITREKKIFFDTEIVLFYLCNSMSKIYSLVYNQWCDLKKSFLIVSISFLINWCHSEDKITHMKQLTHINGSCLINQWYPSLFCLSSLSAMFQTYLEFSLILLLYI